MDQRTGAGQEAEAARRDGRGVVDYLSSMAGVLNDSGKETVVKAALLVAAADGKFLEEEKALIAEIGRALQMTEAHLRGTIAEID